MIITIPQSCYYCKYGNTFDLSVDDLCTYCMVLNEHQDWCDFPNRKDKSLRMYGCPLPNLTELQIAIAEKRLKEIILINKVINKIYHGKTKLIRKRNLSRAKRLAKYKIQDIK